MSFRYTFFPVCTSTKKLKTQGIEFYIELGKIKKFYKIFLYTVKNILCEIYFQVEIWLCVQRRKVISKLWF